jgi:hypothetical protein
MGEALLDLCQLAELFRHVTMVVHEAGVMSELILATDAQFQQTDDGDVLE